MRHIIQFEPMENFTFKIELVRWSSHSFYRDFLSAHRSARQKAFVSKYVREGKFMKKSHRKVDQEAMNIKPASERD